MHPFLSSLPRISLFLNWRDGQPFGRRADFAQPEQARISGKRVPELLEPTPLPQGTQFLRIRSPFDCASWKLDRNPRLGLVTFAG